MSPPFLRSLRLRGFLSFAPTATPIELGRLNVLIGPNGAGKSNLLEAIGLLARLPKGDDLPKYLQSGEGVRSWLWQGNGEARIDATMSWSDDERVGRYSLAFGETTQGRFDIVTESLELGEAPDATKRSMVLFRVEGDAVEVATKQVGPSGPASVYTRAVSPRSFVRRGESLLAQRATPDSFPDVSWLANELSRVYELREWCFGRGAAARKRQGTTGPTDLVEADGSNLSLLINQLDHEGRLEAVVASLRKFLPSVRRISARVSGGAMQTYLHEEHVATPVAAERLSDGTLRFLLLALALARPKPVMIIEEPELGLHPDALGLVAELLVEASAHTQLFVTTHSDALVSALTEHPDAILVCENQGGTQVRRLDGSSLAPWLESYRLGDLWRMGELEGNP